MNYEKGQRQRVYLNNISYGQHYLDFPSADWVEIDDHMRGGDERSYASTNFVSNAIQCRDKRGLGAVVINGFILANHSPVRQQPPCWANLHATVSETNGVIICPVTYKVKPNDHRQAWQCIKLRLVNTVNDMEQSIAIIDAIGSMGIPMLGFK